MKAPIYRAICYASLFTLALILVDLAAIAAVPPRSREELFAGASHVIVGELQAIYSREEESGNYIHIAYVAEIEVTKIEKGDGLQVGQLAYVRYWGRKWIGDGRPPPGSSGHKSIPSIGETVRAYVVKGHQWKKKPDQGLDVILPNGLQASPEDKPKDDGP